MKENKPHTPLNFSSWRCQFGGLNPGVSRKHPHGAGHANSPELHQLWCSPHSTADPLTAPMPQTGGTGNRSGKTSLIKLTCPDVAFLCCWLSEAGIQQAQDAGWGIGSHPPCPCSSFPGVCTILGIYELFSVAYTYLSQKNTMIKITTLANWITSNSRLAMPSIELNMHSCAGNGGFAASQLQTVITAWLADTNVLESHFSPHTENHSYPNRSQEPQQLLAAVPVLVKHSSNLAECSTMD